MPSQRSMLLPCFLALAVLLPGVGACQHEATWRCDVSREWTCASVGEERTTPVSGLRWVNIGTTRPSRGEELKQLSDTFRTRCSATGRSDDGAVYCSLQKQTSCCDSNLVLSEEEWREFDIANVLPSHFVGAVTTAAGETIYFRPDVFNDLLASAEREAAIELQGAPSIPMRMMVPPGADLTIFSRDGKLKLTCGQGAVYNSGKGRCMQVSAGASVRVCGLNFMGARDGVKVLSHVYNGGAIYGEANSAITISSSSFTDNHVDGAGGAIYGEAHSAITISDSSFTDNRARGLESERAKGGGAIYGEANFAITISNVSFKDNWSNNLLTGRDIYCERCEDCPATPNTVGQSIQCATPGLEFLAILGSFLVSVLVVVWNGCCASFAQAKSDEEDRSHDALEKLIFRNQDTVSGCVQIRLETSSAVDTTRGPFPFQGLFNQSCLCWYIRPQKDAAVIADGLTRNAVPQPLVGQCTLQQWQKLLDDLELAASSNSYNFTCMCACLHPLSFGGCSALLFGVFPLGWLFPCVPLYLYYRVGGLKKALDRISTAFVEELPGLDVRIGSFKARDWPVCAPLPLDTYMNTREETFRNGWCPGGDANERTRGWVVLQLVVRERVNAGRSTGPGSYPDNLAAFSTWVRERVLNRFTLEMIKEAEKMATDYSKIIDSMQEDLTGSDMNAPAEPHVEIDVGGGGGGEQAGDGGGEEALEEPGYSTCNMSMLKLVKKGSIDACHLKQPLGPGKSQLVLTNLHDGLAIGPKWDAPKRSKAEGKSREQLWLYLHLGVGVHKAGSIEVHLNDRGFVVWNGKHGEMVFDINFWKLVEGTHLNLLQGVGSYSGKTMDHIFQGAHNRGRLFTQNADGSISPTHAPHLVLGAKRPSANEMKTELLKEKSATHVLEILKARHAAIPEIIANLKERAESFGGYAGLDGIAAGADGQEALSTTAPATVDSMEPVHPHHAARVEPTSPKAIPEGGGSATLAQGPENVLPVWPEVRPAPGEADLGDVPEAREVS